MFLENEVWELCPVKANFSLDSLQVCICHFLMCIAKQVLCFNFSSQTFTSVHC